MLKEHNPYRESLIQMNLYTLQIHNKFKFAYIHIFQKNNQFNISLQFDRGFPKNPESSIGKSREMPFQNYLREQIEILLNCNFIQFSNTSINNIISKLMQFPIFRVINSNINQHIIQLVFLYSRIDSTIYNYYTCIVCIRTSSFLLK